VELPDYEIIITFYNHGIAGKKLGTGYEPKRNTSAIIRKLYWGQGLVWNANLPHLGSYKRASL
jgi:hypothetical protein